MPNNRRGKDDLSAVKEDSSIINDELDLLIEDLNNFAVLDVKPNPGDFDKMLMDLGTRSSAARRGLRTEEKNLRDAGADEGDLAGGSESRCSSLQGGIQDFSREHRSKSASKLKEDTLKDSKSKAKTASLSRKPSHSKRKLVDPASNSKRALRQQVSVRGELPNADVQALVSPTQSRSEGALVDDSAIQFELSNLLACLEQGDLEEGKRDVGDFDDKRTAVLGDSSPPSGSETVKSTKGSPTFATENAVLDHDARDRKSPVSSRVQSTTDASNLNPLLIHNPYGDNSQHSLDTVLNTLAAEMVELDEFDEKPNKSSDRIDTGLSTKTVGLIPNATPKTTVLPASDPVRFDDTDAQIDNMIQAFQSETSALRTEDQSSGTCYTCHKPVFGSSIQALGLIYHVEHFICSMCGKLLDRRNFYSNKGTPCCKSCSAWNTSLQCTSCQKPIIEKAINAFGKCWHPQCFRCFKCETVLTDDFFDIQSAPCCRSCYRNYFSPRCKACGEVITENYLNALGAQWHDYHFVCRVCGVKLESYFEKDGFPYCKQHFSSEVGIVCASCSQPITDLYIEAFGMKWHSHHFVCNFCSTPLPGKKYFEKQGRPYCSSCTNKLFGT
ncbi:transforming growth factor beta-1-induced transcript 1 protein-like [Schistocerca gregaria]|uniref:transforming growth factor beta-1-induced transcript 1 protein-like n=1 Tax=Schistocerca gregaria TaxID=7010 RepID=UPI00211DBF3D|nr:transforming growth factor beta-1-induced transcript 1 protein-like [Schistocerca gregaria]